MATFRNRLCKGCSIIFVPKREDQVFHDNACRIKYYTPKEVMKTCEHCGSSFSTTCPDHQKYCNDDCRKEANKQIRYGSKIIANGTCQLCGLNSRNVGEYTIGIMTINLCLHCHQFVEYLDRGYLEKYNNLVGGKV